MATGFGLQALVRPIKGIEFANIPIGRAVIFTGAMGVGDVLKALVFSLSGGRVPQIMTGLAASWALVNVKMIKNLLGPDIAELAALGIMADTINDQFALREQVSNLLSRFLPGAPAVVSKSPPVLVAGRGRPVTGRNVAARGDIYSSLFGR